MPGRTVLARHQAQEVLFRNLFLFQNADIASVAKDRGAVGNANQLGDAMGDDQDRRAAVAQSAHPRKQPLRGIEIERRRTFIEDEDARFGEKGACNRDPLFQAERQRANQRMRIDGLAGKLFHQLGGTRHLALLRQRLREEPVGAHEDIVDDRAFVRHEHFLVDSGDAERPAFGRRGRRFAENGNGAAIDRQDARDDLGHGGLAAAVTANDRVDLARPCREGGPIERPGRPEILLHATHQDGLPAGRLCNLWSCGRHETTHLVAARPMKRRNGG